MDWGVLQVGISVLQMAISAPGCTGTPADEALVKPPPTENSRAGSQYVRVQLLANGQRREKRRIEEVKT